MALIGHARASTEDQNLVPQQAALLAAGCAEIFEEHASGTSPTPGARPRKNKTVRNSKSWSAKDKNIETGRDESLRRIGIAEGGRLK